MKNFQFTLQQGSTTSAGVYNTNGVLVRTIWNNKRYDAGTHVAQWNGKDDFAQDLANGQYNIVVTSSNIEGTWRGVIGNTGGTAPDKWHSLRPIADIAIDNDTAFVAGGYSEGTPSTQKFKLATPNKKQYIASKNIVCEYVCTDGINVYWSAFNPEIPTHSFVFITSAANDSQVNLANSTTYNSISGITYNAVDFIDNPNGKITGITIRSNVITVTRAGINRISNINVNTGVVTINQAIPQQKVIKYDSGWVICTQGGQQVCCKADNSIILTGLVNPVAFDISPDGTSITVIDTDSHQIKAYSTTTGSLKWTLGELGGYKTSPNIKCTRFDFIGPYSKNNVNPFIKYTPDGSFYIGEPGLCRVQHFSSTRQVIKGDTILYRPTSYSAWVDPGNAKSVYSDFIKYTISYPSLEWKLCKNFAYSVPSEMKNQYNAIKPVTFSGHTYLTLYNDTTKVVSIWEMPKVGMLRDTGVRINPNDSKYFPANTSMITNTIRIYKDGNLYNQSRKVLNKPAVWVKNSLIGIDDNNNPSWGNYEIIGQTPNAQSGDPIYPGNYLNSRSGEITKNGLIVSFAAGVGDQSSTHYHLGYLNPANNTWKILTAEGTHDDYTGDFPTDGTYDVGNGVKYPGSVAITIDNLVIYQYYGENWKGVETNIFNVYDADNGLMVAQFGVADPTIKGVEGVAGMAGNSFALSTVKVGQNIYLYQNDESQHGGVHVWSISNLDTVQKQTISLTLPSADIATDSNTINLLRNLPRVSKLSSNDKWTRDPEDERVVDKYNNLWTVRTDIKTYDVNEYPDLFIQFQQVRKLTSATVMTVSRDLETTGTLKEWSLKGNITYGKSIPNGDLKKFNEAGEGGQFLDILDSNELIIARLAPRTDYAGDVSLLVGNNKTIFTTDRVAFGNILNKTSNFSISSKDGIVKFKYGNYPDLEVPLFDLKADYTRPKTLRLYFWTGIKGNGSKRELGLNNLTFSANTTQYVAERIEFCNNFAYIHYF